MKKTFSPMEYAGLFLTGVMMLSGFWAYCESHFANASTVLSQISVVQSQLNSEADARKELKSEIDALYLHMIPAPERQPLRYPATQGP